MSTKRTARTTTTPPSKPVVPHSENEAPIRHRDPQGRMKAHPVNDVPTTMKPRKTAAPPPTRARSPRLDPQQ